MDPWSDKPIVGGQATHTKIINKQLKNCQQEKDFVVFVPDPKNLLEIHFTLKGPDDPDNQEFAKGLYHGRLLLPQNYPYGPPNVQLLTPNGRFETFKNICFSFTAFHPETYTPAIGISGIILGLQSLFTDYQEHAVGMISNCNKDNIRKLALESRNYTCQHCNINHRQYVEKFFGPQK